MRFADRMPLPPNMRLHGGRVNLRAAAGEPQRLADAVEQQQALSMLEGVARVTRKLSDRMCSE